ncbi:homeobox protein 2-like [Ctenocephalides felis]|uniref:homeobox protein 2-like n=1 Tax=Ctenocephalides felis TaxID=7515 RepID=UPI000E6E2A92|nr:homeobox protein 2-like [Ctenocephalides felis]
MSMSVFFFGGCVMTQFLNNRPYPTYSLENMPDTGFTCRDKILGGYYADSETQCQMFHVCVKVAGVGVQDFRFLCPNGTAFDQDAQICADWGDVDCEATTLYYSSDNFDLYRISSDVESKRAPFAYEEEAPFHLQRAETGDHRLSKQPKVDQKRGDANSAKAKLFNQYNPNIARNQYQNQYSTDNSQDIFRGSHSSNFFNNRNNGKEVEEDYRETPKVESDPKPFQRSNVRVRTRPAQNQPEEQSAHVIENENQLVKKKTIQRKILRKPEEISTSSPSTGYSSQVYTSSTPLPYFDKYQTLSRKTNADNYTPATTKKFSTLVPKDVYSPTTFKPTTYNKVSQIYSSQSTPKPFTAPSTYKPSDLTGAVPKKTPASSTTLKPQYTNGFAASSYLPTTAKPTTVKNYKTTEYAYSTNKQQSTDNQYYVSNKQFNNNPNQFNTNQSPSGFKSSVSTNQYNSSPNQYYNNQFSTSALPQGFTSRPNQAQTTANQYKYSPAAKESQYDDGQYRPEQYEDAKDNYYQNRKEVTDNRQYYDNSNNYNKVPSRATNQFSQDDFYQTTPVYNTRNNYESSSEEYIRQNDQGEFLKTAHSQNIAASGNELKRKSKTTTKSVETSTPVSIHTTQKTTYAYTAKTSVSPKATTRKEAIAQPAVAPVQKQSEPNSNTPKPQKDNASYDYAYYDNSEHPADQSDYENIEEFRKTNKKQ